jgi:KDO2-lipid IV(A) lauroyltransferase
MNDLRRRSGIGVIEPTSLLRVTRTVRSNRFIALLADQDAGSHGMFVEFLGEEASTPLGMARLSVMTGSPVIPGFIIRQDGLRHRIVIEKPLFPDMTAEKEDAVADLTRAFTRVVETYVREHPDHWLWAHRRWKTRPPG